MSKPTSLVPPLAAPKVTFSMVMYDGAGSKSPLLAATVTIAVALLVGSATLVALTSHSPAVPGAMYVRVFPLPLMLPHVVDQATLVSLAPVTVAVNDCVPFAGSVTLVGDTVPATDTTESDPPGGAEVGQATSTNTNPTSKSNNTDRRTITNRQSPPPSSSGATTPQPHQHEARRAAPRTHDAQAYTHFTRAFGATDSLEQSIVWSIEERPTRRLS